MIFFFFFFFTTLIDLLSTASREPTSPFCRIADILRQINSLRSSVTYGVELINVRQGKQCWPVRWKRWKKISSRDQWQRVFPEKSVNFHRHAPVSRSKLHEMPTKLLELFPKREPFTLWNLEQYQWTSGVNIRERVFLFPSLINEKACPASYYASLQFRSYSCQNLSGLGTLPTVREPLENFETETPCPERSHTPNEK